MAPVHKNDPITRTLVILILGTIAFGLLFNLIAGGENMEHTGGMNTMGYNGSIDVFLGGLLVLLVKLLMVVLVIALAVGIVMWIKNTFFQNTNYQIIQSFNNDPILKTVGGITLAVIGIVLVIALLGSLTTPGMGMYGGFNLAFSLAGLLNLLIKVLAFVLVISIILAIFSYLKKQYDAGAFNNFGQTNVPAAPAPAPEQTNTHTTTTQTTAQSTTETDTQ